MEFKESIKKGELLFRNPDLVEEAYQYYKLLRSKYPHNSYLEIRYVELLHKKKKWIEAESISQILIKKSDSKNFTYHFHIHALIKQDKFKQAHAIILEAQNKFPESSNFPTQIFILENLSSHLKLLKKIIRK